MCFQNVLDNIDGIEWYDIGENEESLTEITYLSSSLIHNASGGFTEGPIWINDNKYTKYNGYFLFTEELTGKITKLYYNNTLHQYTSQTLIDLSLIGYNMACGMAYNKNFHLNIASGDKNSYKIIAIAVYDPYGAIIVHNLDKNKIINIYNQLIINDTNNIDNTTIQRNFGSLNDIAMDDNCNIYFTEFTILDNPQPSKYDGIYSIFKNK